MIMMIGAARRTPARAAAIPMITPVLKPASSGPGLVGVPDNTLVVAAVQWGIMATRDGNTGIKYLLVYFNKVVAKEM